MMHRWIIALCGIALPLIGFSQWGIYGHYLNTTLPEWQQLSQEAHGNSFAVQASGPAIGVNYWFRLKTRRIEFWPGLQISLQQLRLSPNATVTLVIHQLSAEWPIAIYPFDLGSDCHCPTFSKQGPALAKGFFVALIPTLSWLHYLPTDSSLLPPDSQWITQLGLRIGLDIGLSRRWTFTPYVGHQWAQSWQYASIGPLLDLPATNVPPSRAYSWQAGLQLRWRWQQ